MNRLRRTITSIREIGLYPGLFYFDLLLLVASIILGWVVNPLWRGLALISTAMIWSVVTVIESKSPRANGFEGLIMSQLCLILIGLGLGALNKSIPRS